MRQTTQPRRKQAKPRPRFGLAGLQLNVATRRRVEYSVYTGNNVTGESTVSELDVVLCENRDCAERAALQHVKECQKGRYFQKTVYVYTSAVSSDALFGYFVCKTMEPKPDVFVNFNGVDHLKSTKPICEHALRQDSVTSDDVAIARGYKL